MRMNMKHLFRLLAAAVILPGPAAAQAVDDIVRLEVRSGWQTETGSRMAALHLTLAPGWKTYWRVPGDSGIPPAFDFAGSENLSQVAFHWPRPSVYDSDGLETVGYADELVLPMEVWPVAAGDAVTIRGHASIGVCRDICLPVELDFAAALPEGHGAADPAIRAALDTVPGAAPPGIVSCAVAPIADGLKLDMTMTVPAQGGQEWVFVETGRADLWASPAVVAREGAVLNAVIELVPPEARPFSLDRSTLRITVLGDTRAVEVLGCQAD